MQEKSAQSAKKVLTGEELRQLRLSKGIGLRELAREASIAPSAISAFEKGTRQGMRKDSLVRIMGVLDPKRVEDFRDKATPYKPHYIPVIGMAAARDYKPGVLPLEMFLAESGEQTLCSIERPGLLALRITGTSMEPEFLENDLVIIAEELPENGQNAVICLSDGSILVKRWYLFDDHVELRSNNPEGQNFTWTKEEILERDPIRWRFKIVGLERRYR